MGRNPKCRNIRKPFIICLLVIIVISLILLLPKHYGLLDGSTNGFKSFFFGSSFYDIRIIDGRTEEYGYNVEAYVSKGTVVSFFGKEVFNNVYGEKRVLQHNVEM